MKMTPDLLKAVCFAILMENNEGIMGKSPSYVREKFQSACPEILDEYNKRKLIRWAEDWGVELKGIVETIIPH